jgi:hypothetical protein
MVDNMELHGYFGEVLSRGRTTSQPQRGFIGGVVVPPADRPRPGGTVQNRRQVYRVDCHGQRSIVHEDFNQDTSYSGRPLV